MSKIDPCEKLTIGFIKKIERIKITGSVVVLLLAAFWGFATSVHPNMLFRILVFSCGFGFTAYGLTLPFIWLARNIENDYETELENLLQSLGEESQ